CDNSTGLFWTRKYHNHLLWYVFCRPSVFRSHQSNHPSRSNLRLLQIARLLSSRIGRRAERRAGWWTRLAKIVVCASRNVLDQMGGYVERQSRSSHLPKSIHPAG